MPESNELMHEQSHHTPPFGGGDVALAGALDGADMVGIPNPVTDDGDRSIADDTYSSEHSDTDVSSPETDQADGQPNDANQLLQGEREESSTLSADEMRAAAYGRLALRRSANRGSDDQENWTLTHDWEGSKKMMWQTALGLTGYDREAAKDLIQETFLRASRAWRSFEQGTNLNGWLFTILNNAGKNDYRRAQRKVKEQPLDITFEDDDKSRTIQLVDDSLSAEEEFFVGPALEDEANKLIAAVPEVYRGVIELVCRYGLTYEEAAATLNIPVGTVMSRLSRARRAIREHQADAA